MEDEDITRNLVRQITRKPVPVHNIETVHQPLLDNPERINDAHADVAAEVENEHDPEPRPSESSSHGLKGAAVRPRRSEKALIILKGWWQEIMWCVISLVAFVALVLILGEYNQEPLPNWPLGITLNTATAALSTIARTAFLIPVSEGLSQSKWAWFKKKARPLADFDLFDQASRGPWGSLGLLIRTKGWTIGILPALLLTSAIATSTLTQSAVTYPSRTVSVNIEGSAAAWKMPYYFWMTAHQNSIRKIMAAPVRGISKGIFTPVTEEILPKEPKCNTSNCTWPQFSTLAVCHNVTNVTHLADIKRPEREVASGTKISLPNGIKLRTTHGYSTVLIESKPTLSYKDTQMEKASLYNYFAIQGPGLLSYDIHVSEVILHWCVKTYNAKVMNYNASMERVMSHTEVSTGYVEMPDGWKGNLTYLTSPADEGNKYVFGGTGIREIQELLNSSIPSLTVDVGTSSLGSTSAMLLQALRDSDSPSWTEAVDGMARNIAMGLTNSLLGSNSNVSGEVLQSEVYVDIHWPWLVFLAAQILFSMIFLALVVIETTTSDIAVVKSSTIPAIFAINAQEKAEVESQLPERGSAVVVDDHDLVLSGIGGELRKTSGKWILGGAKGK